VNLEESMWIFKYNLDEDLGKRNRRNFFLILGAKKYLVCTYRNCSKNDVRKKNIFFPSNRGLMFYYKGLSFELQTNFGFGEK